MRGSRGALQNKLAFLGHVGRVVYREGRPCSSLQHNRWVASPALFGWTLGGFGGDCGAGGLSESVVDGLLEVAEG